VFEDAQLVTRVYQRLGADLFHAYDWRLRVAARDPDERAFLALAACGAEIDNGGFGQVFTNSSGDLVEIAAEGADHFGLHRHADLLRGAIAFFPGGVVGSADDRLERWESMPGRAGADLDSRLQALDEQSYDLEADLERRLADFARGIETAP
jgi:hypothetical protein